MEKLPEDLLSQILAKIPTKDVFRSSLVCKSWLGITSQKYFRDLHANRHPSDLDGNAPLFTTSRCMDTDSFIVSICLAQDSSLDSPKPRTRDILVNDEFIHRTDAGWGCNNDSWISNACNGLVCIRHRSIYQPVIVCNPLTLEHTTLPSCFTDEGRYSFFGSVGLGFSPSTKQYKAVVLAKDASINRLPGKIMAYTLGSGEPCWRHVTDAYFYTRKGPVYAAGKLYWIVHDMQSFTNCLVLFDIESEKLSMISDCPGNICEMEYTLADIGGKLSTIFVEDSCMEIWTLDLKDCGKGYWEMMHKIQLPHKPDRTRLIFPRLLGVWERGDDILQIWLRDTIILCVKRHDSKERCTMYEGSDSFLNKWDLYTGYKPSFVSLKRIGCESKVAHVDLNQYLESPPNCNPKRVVTDAHMDP